jgi:DNA-binding transcriptional MocR family regulator
MESLTLYESVAERVRRTIQHGTFAPGRRIPSVRRLSSELGVSITTVLEAYGLLEREGWIEARPQSGYYVRSRSECPEVEARERRPSCKPADVGVEDRVLRLITDSRNPSLVQLGSAHPPADLLPTARLTRLMSAAARRLGPAAAAYDVPPGCVPLRVQIARRLIGAGCTVTPDEVVTTNGCLEALNLAFRAITRPGDTVAIESPTYFGLLHALQLQGLRVLEIPTHPRSGISVDALRFAIEQNPDLKACLVMSNYNNPLGSLMPDESKRALVELLTEHDIPLIEDDIYGDLCFSAERPRVAKAYDRKDLVILTSSVSKDLSPGFRVGWVVSARFQREIVRLKTAFNIATATLPQYAVADFLENGGYDAHLRRARRVYAAHVEAMSRAVGRYFPPQTRMTRPQGGFVLWVELPGRVDSLQLYEHARAAGISLAPGPIFSARQNRYRNFIRLNCAHWSDAIERAVETLGRLVSQSS